MDNLLEEMMVCSRKFTVLTAVVPLHLRLFSLEEKILKLL